MCACMMAILQLMSTPSRYYSKALAQAIFGSSLIQVISEFVEKHFAFARGEKQKYE